MTRFHVHNYAKNLLYLLGVIGIVCFTAGFSHAMHLEQLIELALQEDPVYKSQIYEASARKAIGWKSKVGYGSIFTINANHGYGRESLSPSEKSKTFEENAETVENNYTSFHTTELLFSFTQPIIHLEKFYLSRWGSSEISAAEVQKRQAKENLILRVCEKYFALLAAKENYRLAEEESRSLEQQVKDAKERLLLGAGTITDKQNAQSRYAIARAALLEKQTQRDTARKTLEEVVGIEFPGNIDDFHQNIKLPEIPHDLAYWEKLALKYNSDYKLAQIQHAASKRKLRATQGRFLPTVNFFADYSRQNSDNTFGSYERTRKEAILGLRLQMDLLSSGQDTFETIAASRQVEAAKKNAEAQKRHLLSTLQSLWLSLENTSHLIEYYAMAVESSKQFLESTKEGYMEGMYSLLDVLNSQREYYRTVSQHKSSRYNYFTLCQQFKKILGINEFSEMVQKQKAANPVGLEK